MHHVVYEYANLLFSAHYALNGQAPWWIHCNDAFLLGCRKVGDFLTKRKRDVARINGQAQELDDVIALDYLPAGFTIPWSLRTWTDEWSSAMNKQLAHIAYKRDREWVHYETIPKLVSEFKTAWKAFLRSITDQEFIDEFQRQIRLKCCDV